MKKWIAARFLKWTGWTLEGVRPEARRCVVIAAPHTSNWDFPLMLAFATLFDLKLQWLGKHALFYPPMGWIMRGMGGMAIKRHRSGNIVTAMVEAFNDNPDLILLVPTEGTRSHVGYWKSGFYHIARQAQVPIVPSYLDWTRKCAGFGAPLYTSGDVVADMQYFRDFYADMSGRFPDKFGPIRLREED